MNSLRQYILEKFKINKDIENKEEDYYLLPWERDIFDSKYLIKSRQSLKRYSYLYLVTLHELIKELIHFYYNDSELKKYIHTNIFVFKLRNEYCDIESRKKLLSGELKFNKEKMIKDYTEGDETIDNPRRTNSKISVLDLLEEYEKNK